MTTPTQERSATSHPLRQAVEARDIEAVVDSLAPDVVLHSPLISEHFEGREDVGFLFRTLADEYLFRDDFQYTAELAEGNTVVLAFRGTLRGTEVEGVDLMRVNPDGKISEITVFLRPLPGTTAVAKFLSSRIAGRDNRLKGVMAGLGTRPLSGLARLFDAIGSRDVRSHR
jgi:ketosteroid isomerase-like protein